MWAWASSEPFRIIRFSVEGNAYELHKPVVLAGEEHKVIPVRIRNEDPAFAPPGKTVLTSAIFTDHAYWKSLEGDHRAYEAEKENVAQAYLDAIEQIWPGISAQVEMINVATPLTFERITGNWKGSITGWKLTPEQAAAKISGTAARAGELLDGWTLGLSRRWCLFGVATGREVIWRQCKKDHQPFVTP